MNDSVIAIVSAFFIIGIFGRGHRRHRPVGHPAPFRAATGATTPTPLTTILTARASRRRAPAGTTPGPTATRAGRGMPTPISAAGRAALGEGKLPRVPGRGRGAR